MKKFLLSLAAVAMATGYASADVVTYDFVNNNYGLTRTSDNNAECLNNGTKIVNGDVTLTVVKGTGYGNGFRLWTDALRVMKNKSQLDVSATNAEITGIEIVTTNTTGLNLAIDGTSVAVGSDKKTYTWTGSVETAQMTFAPTSTARIGSVKVTYEIVSDKTPAGLEFDTAEVVTGVGLEFSLPALKNQNRLPIVYTSSNPEVATVDASGIPTILGIGTTTITATSAETEEYAAGKASYTIKVLPIAANIEELLKLCPNQNDQAIVGFKSTVTYVNGKYCYIKDNAGNATLIYELATLPEKFSVINSGWAVSYQPYYDLPEFKLASASLGKVWQVLPYTYPTVKSVSLKDVNKVVVISDVTFAAATLADNSANFNGTLADGTTLSFRNTFGVRSNPAGKYNVTVAVANYKGSLQVYPISYQAIEEGEKEFITYEGVIEDYKCEEENAGGFSDHKYMVTGRAAEPIQFTFTIPAGKDQMYYLDATSLDAPGKKKAFSVDDIRAYGWNLKEGNTITINPGMAVEYSIFFGFGGQIEDEDFADPIYAAFNLTLDPTVGAKEEITLEGVLPETEKADGTIKWIEETEEDDAHLEINVKTSLETLPVTFTIPEGYDAMYYMNYSAMAGRKAASTEGWMSENDAIGAGLTKGNVINFKPTENADLQVYGVLFGKDGLVNPEMYRVDATVQYDSTVAVEGVEVEAAEAVYYNLQGVKVANPENGIFVKVVAGKAEVVKL